MFNELVILDSSANKILVEVEENSFENGIQFGLPGAGSESVLVYAAYQ